MIDAGRAEKNEIKYIQKANETGMKRKKRLAGTSNFWGGNATAGQYLDLNDNTPSGGCLWTGVDVDGTCFAFTAGAGA